MGLTFIRTWVIQHDLCKGETLSSGQRDMLLPAGLFFVVLFFSAVVVVGLGVGVGSLTVLKSNTRRGTDR
jgi:hypothetical protein